MWHQVVRCIIYHSHRNWFPSIVMTLSMACLTIKIKYRELKEHKWTASHILPSPTTSLITTPMFKLWKSLSRWWRFHQRRFVIHATITLLTIVSWETSPDNNDQSLKMRSLSSANWLLLGTRPRSPALPCSSWCQSFRRRRWIGKLAMSRTWFNLSQSLIISI